MWQRSKFIYICLSDCNTSITTTYHATAYTTTESFVLTSFCTWFNCKKPLLVIIRINILYCLIWPSLVPASSHRREGIRNQPLLFDGKELGPDYLWPTTGIYIVTYQQAAQLYSLQAHKSKQGIGHSEIDRGTLHNLKRT